MKKLLYTLLTVSLIFSSCEKNENTITGCTDENATNFDNSANNSDNDLCIYPTTRVVVTTVDENGQPLENIEVWLNNTCSYSDFERSASSNEEGIAEIQFIHQGEGNSYDVMSDVQAGETYKVFAADALIPPFSYEACGEVELPYYDTVSQIYHSSHNFDVYLTLVMISQ